MVGSRSLAALGLSRSGRVKSQRGTLCKTNRCRSRLAYRVGRVAIMDT